MVQFLGRHEVLEVLVIRPNFHLVLGTLEEVSPLLKHTHYRQHLLVMDLVVSLYSTKAFGVECNRMPLLVLQRLLRQHGTRRKVRTVGFYMKRT